MDSGNKEKVNHSKRQLTRNHSMKDILKRTGLRRNAKKIQTNSNHHQQKQNDNLSLSKSAHEPMQSTTLTNGSGVPMKSTTTRRMFGFNRNGSGQQQQEEDRPYTATKVTTGKPPVTGIKSRTSSSEGNLQVDEKTIALSVVTKKMDNKSRSNNKVGFGSLFRRKKQDQEIYYGNEV